MHIHLKPSKNEKEIPMEGEKIFANDATENTMLYCVFESCLERRSQKFCVWYGC